MKQWGWSRWAVLLVLWSGLGTLGIGQTVNLPKQTVEQTHTWWQIFGTHTLNQKWSIHGEAQVRRADFGATWQQLLLRTGVNRQVNRHLSVSGGYAFIHTYPYGEQPIAVRQPEHRIWEQVAVKHRLGPVPLVEHRFRLEQRFLRNINSARRQLADGYTYQNRVRYRALVTVPFSRQALKTGKIDPGTFFFTANNEAFFNFGRSVQKNVFDQNRFSVGIGYQVQPTANFQVGYLNQYIQKADGVRFENNHTLTLTFTYTANLGALFR